MKTFLIIIIPLISLILAILPFWYVRKKYRPNIKWRHLGVAFLVAVALVIGFTFLYLWIDDTFFYNYSTLQDPFVQVTPFNWLILSLLFAISPLLLYRLKYQIRNKKGYLISVGFIVFTVLLMIALWIFIVILGMAQLQRLG